MTKQIQLTQGKVTLVDDEDYERLRFFKWHDSHGYAVRSVWVSDTKEVGIRMHRVITEAPEGVEVDHINGNRADNRRCNLRVCSRSQNLANRGKQPNNTSGFKGIILDRRFGQWKACIRIKGRKIYSMRCSTAEEAAREYDKLAREHFGQFARLNFPDP